MSSDPYKRLAERLDALPNGYPATADGSELRLLAKLFTKEEAAIASELRLTLESPENIAQRISKIQSEPVDVADLRTQLKKMSRRGLISAGKTDLGLGYGLMPFVVGIYEYQVDRVDAELAQLFEDYYQKAFVEMTSVRPAFHRVIPVGESIHSDIEVQPFESVTEIVNKAQAWGVLDCICRLQKSLVGDPCDHPVDVCMIMSQRPDAFNNSSVIRPLDREGAMETLQRAADAGLVHSVSNQREEISYICNCCTCSCGILRGIADYGIANAIARSTYLNQVDEGLCVGCEDCIEYCQFDALEMQASVVQVNALRCVGCGVCVPFCEDSALSMVLRPPEEWMPLPADMTDWLNQRATARGLDMDQIL